MLTGENQDHIVADLNQRGITTSIGGQWSRESLRQLIRSPRYAGHVVHNGVTVARLPGKPILDERTAEQLNTLFAARRLGRPISDAYLCSGLVFCGRCGYRLTGRPLVSRAPYPDGGVRRQYWCQKRDDRGCGRITVDQRILDRYVGALVVRILSDPQHAVAVEAAAKSVEDKRRPMLAKLTESEELAEELSARLGRQEISLKRYDAAIAPLDKHIAELRTRLAELERTGPARPATAVEAASRKEWTARWNAATVDEKRNLIRQALGDRHLVVAPAVRRSTGRPTFDPNRIRIEDGRRPKQ